MVLNMCVGRGKIRLLMHVFAVGKKDVVAATNFSVGFIVNPSTGSSSVPQENCST
jgi:hypothetical protein